MNLLTTEEVNQLARDIVTDKVFIPKNAYELNLAFPILKMAMLDKEHIDQTGLIYEYYYNAGPRSINGLPFFFSARFVHKDSVAELQAEVNRMMKALNLNMAQPETQEEDG